MLSASLNKTVPSFFLYKKSGKVLLDFICSCSSGNNTYMYVAFVLPGIPVYYIHY